MCVVFLNMALTVEQVATGDLIPYARNARTHSPAQVAEISASVREFGWTNPVLIDEGNVIIAGHGRVMAAEQIGMDQVPCIRLADLSETQKRALRIADNKLALHAGWDEELLRLEIVDLQLEHFDITLTGFAPSDFAEDRYAAKANGQLAEEFVAPPFTVLDARQGYWQDRKHFWTILGIASQAGRDMSACTSARNAAIQRGKAEGGSIFDPVLSEVAYSWFAPPTGLVLDPFAGGSVRGIVAAILGRSYFGVDLRPEQVEANRQQAAAMGLPVAPEWCCGDSLDLAEHFAGREADMVFSCPPYADLEVYSDDPRDLSRMRYGDFLAAYRRIVEQCFDLLAPDSFAVWVVGEVRDRRGRYRNFVGDTVAAFKAAGFAYYNEAVLLTPAGSLPLRAGAQMRASRKLGKAHQNVLVFVKGSARAAAERCGDISVRETPSAA